MKGENDERKEQSPSSARRTVCRALLFHNSLQGALLPLRRVAEEITPLTVALLSSRR